MDNLKQNIIREIAQELDCGNECYYNLKTNEIIAIPNFSQVSDEEEFKEIFCKDLEKINGNKTGFIKIEIPESFQSFKIMERFVVQLNDQNFKSELQDILGNKKPFRNFKNTIDQSEFRQSWFDFKQKELEKTVENQLK
ncbi:UPF0158 family protein [Olleya sp. R77988]|uniref:UPF0158 family protein n=1 Tax=Olleya sp. R77988 TaxID=3093875 RepID=UPI0037C555D0